jgi:dTDP-glucose 4,6-dehydratase
MKLIITGGAGFIGSNFINHLVATGDKELRIINVDSLTYAGNLDNLSAIDDDPRYTFLRADISDSAEINRIIAEHKPDAILNFAAESHVDRSIEDASPFVRTNIQGTQVLLDSARHHQVKRFLHISTDEVYGSLGEEDPAFTEDSPIDPSSPYAASKAAADHLVQACHRTYGLDTVITRCSNNYGPYQFPEKLIPLMIGNAMNDEPLPVYGDGRNIRDWIYVADHCRALAHVLREGRPGRVYNIGGSSERRNIDVVKAILKILGKPESLIRFVSDRPGHDWRYAMDTTCISAELGWQPSVTFEEGLEETIQWYSGNSAWTRKVISGEYLDYYDRMYGSRLT